MKNVGRLLSDNNDSNVENLVRRFLQAAIQICEFGKSIGINIIPATDSSLPIFRSLPYAQQLSAVEKLELSCDIYLSISRDKQDLRNPNTLVWMACSKMGLVPPSDFFDKLQDDDIIQVYSKESIHQFANLRFFAICSYTLEQIYSYPWHLLWERNESDLAKLIEAAQKSLEPDQRSVIAVNSRVHRVVEVSSPFKFETEYSLRYIAPLFDSETREKAGFIVAESVKVVKFVEPHDEERLLNDFTTRFNEGTLDLSRFQRK